MKKIFSVWLCMLCTAHAFAQHSLKAIIKDKESRQALQGVTVVLKGTSGMVISGADGSIRMDNIPAGTQTILFSHTGYGTVEKVLDFPTAEVFIIDMEAEEEDLEEVIIQSTRTSRTIQNTPTRIETIDFEEIDEKSNMRPSNVSMLLHESTGIQVQQTSATSANASIRMQGLDGRYTQLLKDGYASFGNFASGLSILEIPPLDLKQVEVIKGPASTLYGGGAIAGVVNFISKTPKEKAERNFILNQSNIGQTNIGIFSSQRNKKIGYSLLASYNYQKAYDVDKDEFTELPKSNDFTIHPKLFYYPTGNTTLILGNSFSKAERTGGDITVIKGKADNDHTYFERNNTTRNTSTLDFTQRFRNKGLLSFKSGFSYFNRQVNTPGYEFKGINYNSFNDITYTKDLEGQTILIGGNFIYDKFSEHSAGATGLRNFTTTTGGLYTQHTWDAGEKLKLESGLRADLVHYSNSLYSKTALYVLPRVSAMFIFNNKFTSRITAGMGYKTPTIFNEQTESFQYKNVLPLNGVSGEKSYGLTADVNYKTSLSTGLKLSVNQLFFFTRIGNASVLETDGQNNHYFVNATQPVNSAGLETNLKIISETGVKFFLGYTFTHAKANDLTGSQFIKLLPKNKLNLALIYEKESNIKLGLEAYFTGSQHLNDDTKTPSFWELGFMAEKTFGRVALFINAENFTDVRQSRYKRVVNDPHDAPTFDDIWTHTEGRTFNGGIKLKF
ncbi:MAG: TonB-dependent receptor plug domain-containing protein [Ferruginibacter sp.]